jgi:hypothetical protein
MDKCFVIQPFDNGKYDQRFTDTFKPAINKAGLDAYRIDGDLNVRVPIDEIEQGIKDSVVCFAEISTDNPNVWYELGYAFAHGKDVVMVCSDDRTGQFPFDIRHRLVLKYKTGSKSDFESIEELISNKIKALISTSQTVKTLVVTPVVEQEGLNSHEIALLLIIAENQFTSDDSIAVHSIKNEMGKAGYTDIAVGIAVRLLLRKELIQTWLENGWNNDNYLVAKLTAKGEDWVLSNQDKLIFRKDQQNTQADEDLPF